MTARCAVCSIFTLKGQIRASEGMYTCRLKPAYQFRSATRVRVCADFKQVESADLPARLKWEGKQ